jgi:hypothetical protein
MPTTTSLTSLKSTNSLLHVSSQPDVKSKPLATSSSSTASVFESSNGQKVSNTLTNVVVAKNAKLTSTKNGPSVEGRALIEALHQGKIPTYASLIGGELSRVPSTLQSMSRHASTLSLSNTNALYYSDDIVAVPKSVQKYMSGSNTQALKFEDSVVQNYLASIFHHIQDNAALTAVELAGWDLYHGHFFSYVDPQDSRNNDLGILFHAKEHPTDFVVGQGQPDPREGSQCCSTDHDYHLRNYLWLMSTNQVVLLNPKHKDFPRKLMSPTQAAASTVSEDVFMSTNLGSINYFPGLTKGSHDMGEDLLVAAHQGFPVDLKMKQCENDKEIKVLIDALSIDGLLELQEVLRSPSTSKRLKRIPEDKRVAIKLWAAAALQKKNEKRLTSMLAGFESLVAKKYKGDDAFQALLKTENNGVFSVFRAECILKVMAKGYDLETAFMALNAAHVSGSDVEGALAWLAKL